MIPFYTFYEDLSLERPFLPFYCRRICAFSPNNSVCNVILEISCHRLCDYTGFPEHTSSRFNCSFISRPTTFDFCSSVCLSSLVVCVYPRPFLPNGVRLLLCSLNLCQFSVARNFVLYFVSKVDSRGYRVCYYSDNFTWRNRLTLGVFLRTIRGSAY